jgi:hypothetical protein
MITICLQSPNTWFSTILQITWLLAFLSLPLYLYLVSRELSKIKRMLRRSRPARNAGARVPPHLYNDECAAILV